MNERIRELAEQCRITEYNEYGDLIEFGFNEEKFAQLIVQECAKITEEVADGDSRVRKWVLEHFGVEEPEKVAPEPKCSVCGTTENVKYMGGYQPYLCDSVDCIPF